MNKHRRMALAVTTCAAGLSVTACNAGITIASHAPSPSPSASAAASSTASSAAPAASPTTAAPAADTVSLGGSIGSFPIPPGAQVVDNSTCDKEILVELTGVTPTQASGFYMLTLPRAGYKITGHTLMTNTGNSGLPGATAEIDFTGHGYRGQFIGVAGLGALSSAGASALPSSMNGIEKNLITITLTPSGTADCPSLSP